MPTRNANSVAAGRLLVPASIAMKIVAAERDVPGNIAATICARPTRTATIQLTFALSGRFAAKYSAAIIHTPPMTNAQATGVMRSGSLKPSLVTTKPRTAVIRNATVNLAA